MGVSYADSMKAWVLGLAAGFGLALGTTAADAQLAVYGKFDLLHNSQDEDNSSIANNLQTTFFYGGGVGVYDDFFHVGPVHVGVDVRGDVLTGKYSNYRDVLGGVRVAVKIPFLSFRPYVQGSVGAGGTRGTSPLLNGITSNSYATKFTYVVFGGLDRRIVPHVDFRAIEVGVGQQTSDSDAVGASKPVLVFISSGLVVRF